MMVGGAAKQVEIPPPPKPSAPALPSPTPAAPSPAAESEEDTSGAGSWFKSLVEAPTKPEAPVPTAPKAEAPKAPPPQTIIKAPLLSRPEPAKKVDHSPSSLDLQPLR